MSSALDSTKPAFRPGRAFRRGNLLFTGGIAALDRDGSIAHPGNVKAQTRQALQALADLLGENGGGLDDVVCITSFHADPRAMRESLDIARQFFPADAPAWTPVAYLGCQHPGALVMIRAVAHLGPGSRRCFVTDRHSSLYGYPISAACEKGGLLFIAGQSAVGPQGHIEVPVDHRRQARAAYDRILELLELAGGGIDDVLDFTSFHLDIRGAIATLEDIYIPQVIGVSRSERAATTSHIGSAGLLRPEMLGVYTAIAELGNGERIGHMPEVITWNDNGNYPIAGAARKANGKLITVAGQVSSGPDGNVLHPGDIEEQLRFIFEEIRDSIEGLGARMTDVAEVCSYHKDTRSWDTVMRVAGEFFDADAPPAWSFVGSPGLWKEGYQQEIAAFAILD